MKISPQTARRFILGRQGLWPGRRWRGVHGTERAMRAMEHLQLDPLAIMARAQDLMLHSRVIDYQLDDWARLTYDRRKFFDWGGWLAVRPMDELPYWRNLMRREREMGHWREVEHEHHETIVEMRQVLRERGTVANRDFDDGQPQAHGLVPRAEGQRGRALLPVADRRRDGPSPRAVRAGVRPDRGRRAAPTCSRRPPTPRPTTSCVASTSRSRASHR